MNKYKIELNIRGYPFDYTCEVKDENEANMKARCYYYKEYEFDLDDIFVTSIEIL